MSETLVVHALENHSKGTDKAFSLKIGKETFAFFYASHSGCTFAWDSAVDFSQIEEKIISFLLAEGLSSSFKEELLTRKSKTKVSFILCGESDELLEFDLQAPQQVNLYKKALEQSQRILFARYDITLGIPEAKPSKFYTYSITIENHELLSNPSDIFAYGREMAIRIPWRFPAFLVPPPLPSLPLENYLRPDYLCARITENHYASTYFKERIDYEESISTIDKLILVNAKYFIEEDEIYDPNIEEPVSNDPLRAIRVFPFRIPPTFEFPELIESPQIRSRCLRDLVL